MPFRIRHVIFNRSSITVDIYNVPGRLYFLEICPSWTSLLRIGLLLILKYCPSRTFISGRTLIRYTRVLQFFVAKTLIKHYVLFPFKHKAEQYIDREDGRLSRTIVWFFTSRPNLESNSKLELSSERSNLHSLSELL